MFTQAKSQDEAFPNGVGRILQQMAVVFLGVMALACVHALLWHLHYILAPFVLSGFLVFAVEPSVNIVYGLLAGLAPPYRWCCCGMHRRYRKKRRRRDDDVEQSTSGSESSDGRPEEADDRQEMQTLTGFDDGADWEGFWIRILDGLCRMAAVAAAILGLILIAFFLISMLARGAYEVKENWKDYQVGMRRLLAIFDNMRDGLVKTLKLSGKFDVRVKMIYTNAVDRVQELVLALVNSIAGFVTGGVSFAAMVVLYMLFWLFQPLPLGGTKASVLVRSYIWKKTIVSLLYGCSVATLLFCLDVDLPVFFGIVSFFFNYVPEVGAFISMLAPMPIILLDGKLESPITWLLIATLGQIALKLLIGNVLELSLIQDDAEMSIHPVWVLLGLNYFSLVWGLPGMLVSVPIMATLKSLAISAEEELKVEQPALSNLLSRFLACLEGRKKRGEKQRRKTLWMLPFVASAAERVRRRVLSIAPRAKNHRWMLLCRQARPRARSLQRK